MPLTPADIRINLQPLLNSCPEIVAAYLFGSAATSKMRPDSDIDIAVLLDESDGHLNRKIVLSRLHPQFCRALRADAHLLFLNDASYLVRMQVFNKGILMHVKNPYQLAVFRMHSTALYADFAPIMRMTQQGLKNKLKRRGNPDQD